MVSIMEYGTVTSQPPQAGSSEQGHQADSLIVDEETRMTSKSAVSQRSIELQIANKSTDTELAKKALKLDLVKTTSQEVEDFSVKSPKSPHANSVRTASRQQSINSVSKADLLEDRKTLRDALYTGIFHRHRSAIFALGSFLRMLKSRNAQYNTIRSSSEAVPNTFTETEILKKNKVLAKSYGNSIFQHNYIQLRKPSSVQQRHTYAIGGTDNIIDEPFN